MFDEKYEKGNMCNLTPNVYICTYTSFMWYDGDTDVGATEGCIVGERRRGKYKE